jgi:hypothetical protein
MNRLSILLTDQLPKAKSKAAQITELLPEIEAAVEAGHSHEAIFENVKKTTGLDLTFGYYKNTLHRVRRKTEAKSKTVAKPPAAHGLKPITVTGSPSKAAQKTDEPTSKLQAALSEAVGDFFS